MIVCSCNVLTKRIILETAAEIAAASPGRPLTPARVYRELGVRAQCTVCFTLVRKILAESGALVTCPEPLGTSAEESTGIGAL